MPRKNANRKPGNSRSFSSLRMTRSLVPPFHRSTVPPFHRSTVPPFHRSTVPPFQHSAASVSSLFQALPSQRDVALLCPNVADRQTQRETIVQFRVREKD